METNRFVADCRKFPSEKNCSLLIAGTEEEVLAVAVEHAVAAHGHTRGQKLRDELKGFLEKEPEVNASAEKRNRELALNLYDAFNKRDFDRIESYADPGVTMTNVATEEVFRGPKGLRAYGEGWAKAFPDAKVEVDRVIASSDGFAAEIIGSGTHKGVLSSPAGSVQPTGRRVRMRLSEIFRARDGKIVEGSAYFDLASLMKQLGLGQQPQAQTQAQMPTPEAGQGAERRH
jgi:predicted ester cyclase